MKYHTKKRWIFLGIFFIAALGAFTLFLSIGQEGEKAYQEVLNKSTPSVLSRSDTEYQARQLKEGVRRQFWYKKGDRSLQVCLSGEKAEMVFDKKGEEQEIVEHMQGVCCWLQENVYSTQNGNDTRQLVRYLEAKSADYHYGSEVLNGEHVRMKLYEAPGKELDYNATAYVPLMKGIAGRAVLDKGKLLDLRDNVSLEDQKANIQAGQALIDLKGESKGRIKADHNVNVHIFGQLDGSCECAEYYPDGRVFFYGNVRADSEQFGTFTAQDEVQVLTDSKGEMQTLRSIGNSAFIADQEDKGVDMEVHCHGELLLDLTKETVFFSSPKENDGSVEEENQAFFRDHLGRVFADQAEVAYQIENGKTKPCQVTLEGNVRLFNRQGAALQYALADKSIFDTASHRMRLIAKKGKRVLFFDKVNNLQISARELWMTRDKATGKSKVKGIGDVRFEFQEKEFEQIRTLMSRKGSQG